MISIVTLEKDGEYVGSVIELNGKVVCEYSEETDEFEDDDYARAMVVDQTEGLAEAMAKEFDIPFERKTREV